MLDLTAARDIVLVPYFAADGWHVSETVPADLGLVDGRMEREGRRVRVAAAVGSSPDLFPLVLQRVLDAAGRP